MATIKSYTDIEQSKKLAEILPLGSADMCWTKYIDDGEVTSLHATVNYGIVPIEYPCWSFTALFGVLPNGIAMNKDSQNGRYHFSSKYIGTYVTANNPIDACYEMIIKLHEKGLL